MMQHLRPVTTALLALCLMACAGTPAPVSVSLLPKTVDLKIGEESGVLTATVAGADNKNVTWTASPNTGTITVLDETRATFKAPTSGTYTVTATSAADATKKDISTITVKPNVGLTLDRVNVNGRTGAAQAFTATVQNSTDSSVQWDIEPDDQVQVTTQGNTAFVTFAKSGSYTVTATSKADANAKASAQATITPAVAVSLNAQSASLDTGDQGQFIATVQNAVDSGVNWTVTPSDNATLVVNGNLVKVSADKAGSYLLTATSNEDRRKTASAQITVADGITVGLEPKTPSVTQGGAQIFAAIVQNDTGAQGVDWSVTPTVGATSSSSSITGITYTFSAAGTYFVTATSKANPAKKDTATVTVTAGVNVTVSPDDVSMQTGQTKALTATVTGSADASVTWSLNPATGGTLTPTGSSASFAPTAAGTYTVTATSIADPTKKDTAIVRVTTPIKVNLAPATGSINLDQTQTVSATVTGTTDLRLAWNVVPSDLGSLEVTGQTAVFKPFKKGTGYITATSLVDPNKAAVSSITVNSTAAISLSPTSANLETGEAVTLTATVTGALNKNVFWSVTPSASATISPNGGAASFSATQPGTYTITATSEADSSVQATATVTVKPAFTITITSNPPGGTKVGRPISFTAIVTGVADTSVTWSGAATSTGPTTASFSSLSIGRYTAIATANGDSRTPKRSVSYSFNVTFNR
jgi:trimeric autotransporter adhesin